MRPVDSIRQLIPVLTLRTMGSRFSTARKAQMAACWGSSVLGITRGGFFVNRTNQPSLLILTSQSMRLRPCAIEGEVPPDVGNRVLVADDDAEMIGSGSLTIADCGLRSRCLKT